MVNTNHETNFKINLTKNYSLVRPSKSSHSIQKKIKCSAGCVVACSIKVHNLNRGGKLINTTTLKIHTYLQNVYRRTCDKSVQAIIIHNMIKVCELYNDISRERKDNKV